MFGNYDYIAFGDFNKKDNAKIRIKCVFIHTI